MSPRMSLSNDSAGMSGENPTEPVNICARAEIPDRLPGVGRIAVSTSLIDPRTTTSARSSISVGSALTITILAPARSAIGTMAATGYTLSVEPMASSRSHSSRRLLGPEQVARVERLAERDRGRLQHSPAHQARRVLLAGPDPVEGGLDRAASTARQARRLVDRAVHLDHLVRVGAGGLVQAVDVLGDQRVQHAPALELEQGLVAGVRRAAVLQPGRAGPARRAGRTSGSRDVELDVRRLLGLRVLRPDALRAPEVGDAAVGRDAGPGEHADRSPRRREALGPAPRPRDRPRASTAQASRAQASPLSLPAPPPGHPPPARHSVPLTQEVLDETVND